MNSEKKLSELEGKEISSLVRRVTNYWRNLASFLLTQKEFREIENLKTTDLAKSQVLFNKLSLQGKKLSEIMDILDGIPKSSL